MMKEADLNQNGCVDFKSFAAITRSASETLSAMAGRYIASNQIGRGAIRIRLIQLISTAFLSTILYG